LRFAEKSGLFPEKSGINKTALPFAPSQANLFTYQSVAPKLTLGVNTFAWCLLLSH
jgi:hypothetical protein